jgi:hypothetical protein
MQLALKKIDQIINLIKVQGKQVYINAKEIDFKRVYHDYSTAVDGFLKWKNEVESILL